MTSMTLGVTWLAGVFLKWGHFMFVFLFYSFLKMFEDFYSVYYFFFLRGVGGWAKLWCFWCGFQPS